MSLHNAAPLLVIVGGAPGSGKTTLALRLGDRLRLPVFSKDGFKETLYDTLGVEGAAGSAELGRAAIALLAVAAECVLSAGASVVIEANFWRGVSEATLTPLLDQARGLVLHCDGDAETIVRRYRDRAARGERHPGHDDLHLLDVLRERLASDRYEPPNLPVPLLRIDTTTAAGYAPGFDEIVSFVEQRLTVR